MKSIKLSFKHTSLTFEATSLDGVAWTIKKPALSQGDFTHVAGQVSLQIRKHIPEVVKFLAREDCELSLLSFGRKFATCECEPQEVKEEIFKEVKDIIAYDVEVKEVVVVEEAA